MNWTDIKVGATASADPVAGATPAASTNHTLGEADAAALMDAAARFSARGQSKNAATCEDIAAKLRRFGSYASVAQTLYAAKLILWSQETPRTTHGMSLPQNLQVPVLWQFMQTTGELFLGDVKLARKRADTLVWVKAFGVCGSIQAGTFFASKRWTAEQTAVVSALLLRLESNPAEIIRAIGREYGACCLCGQELSNPESIAAGIGPVCAGRI